MAKVKISEITEKVKKIFMNEGVDEATADIVTASLVESDMKGVWTHGTLRVPLYVTCLRSGGIRPTGNIEIISDSPTMARVNGKGGLGIAIAHNATKLAIEKAKATGVGIVSIMGSHHFGAAGTFASMCADEGMIGLSMSNTGAMIAPTGACVKGIGNNPFSYAVPAGKYGTVLYDIAISMGSDMKIIAMQKTGEKLPDGWLIDREGKPTNDPNEYRNGAVLAPFGGYKGYGLALMVEFFAAVLSGGGMTFDSVAWNKDSSKEDGGNVGQFVMAIDISRLMDKDEFISRAEDLIDRMKSCEKAVGVDEIYYPGEKEKLAKEAALASGYVEIKDDTLAAIDELLK